MRTPTTLIGSVVAGWPQLEHAVLGPSALPRHPLALGAFRPRGAAIGRPPGDGARSTTRARARCLRASPRTAMLPLDRWPTGGVGLVLDAMAHIAGWAFPRGGAQRLADALAAHLRSLGGEIMTSTRSTSIDELPAARAVLCDLSPRPLLRIAGRTFPGWYRRALERYRYGMGVFKVDWALDAPIPWTRRRRAARAGTFISAARWRRSPRRRRDAWDGRISERPFVLLAQPTLFDPTRAPAGKHTAWAYCHVPHGSTVDMLPIGSSSRSSASRRDSAIGCWRDRVMTPADIEAHNANLVGGDIAAGVTDLRQLFARPTWRYYSTPASGLYICSASTPPGVGVHGMCGYFAAMKVLKDWGRFRRRTASRMPRTGSRIRLSF